MSMKGVVKIFISALFSAINFFWIINDFTAYDGIVKKINHYLIIVYIDKCFAIFDSSFPTKKILAKKNCF